VARVRFSDTVSLADVEEALRLYTVSQCTLEEHQQHKSNIRQPDNTPTSDIYRLMRQMVLERAGGSSNDLAYSQVLERVIAGDYNEQHLIACISEYEDLNVLFLNQARTKISFVVTAPV